MRLGKVARLAETQGGRWEALLEALQAERAARLTRGQRVRPPAAEGVPGGRSRTGGNCSAKDSRRWIRSASVRTVDEG